MPEMALVPESEAKQKGLSKASAFKLETHGEKRSKTLSKKLQCLGCMMLYATTSKGMLANLCSAMQNVRS